MVAEAPAGRTSGRFSRIRNIGLGLFLTLVGIFLLSVLIPTAPARLGYALGVGAVGILAVWVGGILMGVGSRS
jgi:hypothetical protein